MRQGSSFDSPVTVQLLVDATVDPNSNQPVGGTVIGNFAGIRTTDDTYLLEQRNAITPPTPVNGKNVHNLFIRFTAPSSQWSAQRLDWFHFDNAPAASPSFSSSVQSSNSITLNWSNVNPLASQHWNLDASGSVVSGEVDGYDIYYSTSPDFAVGVTGHQSASAATTSRTVTGLLAHTRYYFRLVANDTYRTPKTSIGLPAGYAWNVGTFSAVTA
jgi:hypothetical protein